MPMKLLFQARLKAERKYNYLFADAHTFMKGLATFCMLCLATMLFSGCFNDQADTQAYDISGMTEEITSEENAENQPKITFIDFAKSIELKEKMECDYKVVDEETKKTLKAKIYVEGDVYRSITWESDDKVYSVFDGEVFYGWSDRSKKGFSMASSCAEEFEQNTVDIESDGDVDLDTYKTSSELFDEKVSMNCKESSFVDLSIPDDIDFVDQCELLKQQRDAIEKINDEALGR